MLLFAFRAVRRLPGHRPFAEIMPEGKDGLLFLERFAADGALAAIREARFRTGRSRCGHRYGRMCHEVAVFLAAGRADGFLCARRRAARVLADGKRKLRLYGVVVLRIFGREHRRKLVAARSAHGEGVVLPSPAARQFDVGKRMPDADAQVFGRGIGGIGLGDRERDDELARVIAHARDGDRTAFGNGGIGAVCYRVIGIGHERCLAVLHGHGGFDRPARIYIRVFNAAHHLRRKRFGRDGNNCRIG